MSTYAKLNLKTNPFINVKPKFIAQDDYQHLIWAGMPNLKRKLEEIHRQAFAAPACQIIMNWGAVGAGKTHAASYFNEIYLQSLMPDYSGQIFHIYTRTPKEGNSAANQLYKDILDGVRLSRLKIQIERILTSLGKERFLELLTQKIRSEEFAKAIVFLGVKKELLQVDYIQHEDTERMELMSRYLYGTASKAELKQLGLARDLASIDDVAKMLGAILLCFTNIPETPQGKIFLWIDEMENLMWFKQNQYLPFSQFLRDLFDQIDEGLTIFMNFTFTEPDLDTIKMLLGEALWSRITKHIRFNELSVDEAIRYCQELLQPQQLEDKGSFSPFTEEALRTLLGSIQPAYMTPREINKRCSSVLSFALASENISVISEEVISKWSSLQQEENVEEGV